jgi:hypothetical protein
MGFALFDFPVQGLLRKMISILLEEEGLVDAGEGVRKGWWMQVRVLGRAGGCR